MKNRKVLVLLLCFILLGGMATSCTEEDIQPTNAGEWKDGNVTGMDDWYKHNT